MSREDPQLKLRLTEKMKSIVTASAKKSGRSVNAEIVAQLERAYGLSISEREQAFADALSMLHGVVSDNNR